MGLPVRRAAKVDANQADIVKGLRRHGCSVLPLHAIGQGCPDLLVARSGNTMLMEIKDGNKPPSHRKLTPDQEAFHERWHGAITTVCNLDEAILAVKYTLGVF